MEQEHLDNFLGRIRKILATHFVDRERVSGVISNIVGFQIEKDCIEIKNGKIKVLNQSPVLKNELFIHKSKIEKGLQENGFNLKIY